MSPTVSLSQLSDQTVSWERSVHGVGLGWCCWTEFAVLHQPHQGAALLAPPGMPRPSEAWTATNKMTLFLGGWSLTSLSLSEFTPFFPTRHWHFGFIVHLQKLLQLFLSSLPHELHMPSLHISEQGLGHDLCLFSVFWRVLLSPFSILVQYSHFKWITKVIKV